MDWKRIVVGLTVVLVAGGLAPVVEGMRTRAELRRLVEAAPQLPGGDRVLELADEHLGYLRSSVTLRLRGAAAQGLPVTEVRLEIRHGPVIHTAARTRFGMGAIGLAGGPLEGVVVFTYGGRAAGRLRWGDVEAPSHRGPHGTLDVDFDRDNGSGSLVLLMGPLDGDAEDERSPGAAEDGADTEGAVPLELHGLDVLLTRDATGTHVEVEAPYLAVRWADRAVRLSVALLTGDWGSGGSRGINLTADVLRANVGARSVRVRGLSISTGSGPAAQPAVTRGAAVNVDASLVTLDDGPPGNARLELQFQGLDPDALDQASARLLVPALGTVGAAIAEASGRPPARASSGPSVATATQAALTLVRASSISGEGTLELGRGDESARAVSHFRVDGQQLGADTTRLVDAFDPAMVEVELEISDAVARRGTEALLAQLGESVEAGVELRTAASRLLTSLVTAGFATTAEGALKTTVRHEPNAPVTVGGLTPTPDHLAPVSRTLSELFPPAVEVSLEQPQVRGRRSLGSVLARLGEVAPELRRCADRALADRAEAVDRRLAVSFRIAPEGQVSEVEVAHDDEEADTSALDLCFVAILSRETFGPGGSASLVLPIHLRRPPRARRPDPTTLVGPLLWDLAADTAAAPPVAPPAPATVPGQANGAPAP